MINIDLGIPKENIYNQFIAKKQFYQHGNFRERERRIFVKGIERITLYSQLTKDNTNIDEYKDEDRNYKEISIMLVELRDKSSLDKMADLIMESIPYPMLLIAIYEGEFIFYAAHHRENKVDREKTIVEKIYSTDFMDRDSEFIDKINYKNLDKQNLYKFYDSYLQAILDYQLEKRNVSRQENKEELLEEISKIENKIQELRKQIKRKPF